MKILSLLFFLFISAPLIATPRIVLSEGEIYIREGFNKSFIQKMPVDSDWLVIQDGSSVRSLRVPNLSFPGTPERNFLSPGKNKPGNYTFIFPFTIKETIDVPAIYIKELGVNWELYINGTVIASENHLDENGKLNKNRSIKELIVPFSEKLLVPGTNFFAARIIGEPNNPLTGFYRMPIIIGSHRELAPLSTERVTLMLIAVYLAIGLYHIMLFLFNRKEKYNLFFGIIGVLFFFYIFFRTSAAFEFITDSSLLLRGELITLYALIPSFGFFFDLIIKKKISRVTSAYTGFSLFLILPTIWMPEAFIFDVLRIWQYTALIPILYYLVFVLTPSFLKEAAENSTAGLSMPAGAARALVLSVPGNILAGVIILAACMIFDIYDALYLSLGLSVTQYGFFALVMGIAFLLSNRFLYIHKQIESLNKELEDKIEDIDRANRLITLSEEKYRLLVEGTNEVIFLLDESLCFKTVNRIASSKLGVSAERIKGRDFIDFLYSGSGDRSVELQYVLEKIKELKEKKQPVSFKVQYKSPQTLESSELQVRLEILSIQGSEEILGRISRVSDDSLQPYFIKEKSSYAIGNQLSTAEEASYRLTRNLSRYMDFKEISLIRIALREMIVNAIEHGNLEVTFEDKSGALESDSYFHLIAERQKNPLYANRKVSLEYKITSEKAEYLITDNGKGFNHKDVDQRFKQSHEGLLAHGRGIVMARSIFDTVTWNNKGNQVLLVKNFT